MSISNNIMMVRGVTKKKKEMSDRRMDFIKQRSAEGRYIGRSRS